MCVPWCTCGVRGQLVEVGFLLPGHQANVQALFPSGTMMECWWAQSCAVTTVSVSS